MKSKFLSLDLLRILGALAVIVIHVNSAVGASFETVPLHSWWMSHFFTTLARWAVPVFLIVSGVTVAISPPRNYLRFVLKKLQRIGIPLVFWVIAYAIYNHLFFRLDPLSVEFVLERFIYDQPYEHLYFLVLLLQMAVLAPLMYQTFSSKVHFLPQLTFLLLVVIALLYRENRFILTLFIPYMYYFFGGMLIGHSYKNISLSSTQISILLGSFIGATTTILVGTYWLVSHPIRPIPNGLYFYTNINPVLAVQAFSLFLLFWGNESQILRRLSAQTIHLIKVVSPFTYGVYLFHLMPLGFLQAATDNLLIQFVGTVVISFALVKVLKRTLPLVL